MWSFKCGCTITSNLGVGVGALPPAEGGNHIDEAPDVLLTALGTAGLPLLLFLGFNLGGLSLHFSGTGQGTVNLSSEHADIDLKSGEVTGAGRQELVILKRASR